MEKLTGLVMLIMCQLVLGDYELSIELNKFNNQFATMMTTFENGKCPMNKCLTYFKFCLLTDARQTDDEPECLSKFVTQIIGENVIDQEQFQLTTNSIKFRLTRDMIDDRDMFAGSGLYLLIQVLNFNEMDDMDAANLISEWKLPIRMVQLNKWIRYEHSVNFKLKQVFLFNYMLNCADDYYGSKCDMRKCLFYPVLTIKSYRKN